MTESQQNIEDADRWLCARHGALKIDQTYKLAFIRAPRKTRRCKKCREPVSYISQAEAAELPSKDSKPGVTLEQRDENVHRAVRLMKELRAVIIELAGSINRAGESLRVFYELAATIQADDTDDEPAWKQVEGADQWCPKCSRSPFQYRLDGAQITYGCKCGHEWEAGSELTHEPSKLPDGDRATKSRLMSIKRGFDHYAYFHEGKDSQKWADLGCQHCQPYSGINNEQS